MFSGLSGSGLAVLLFSLVIGMAFHEAMHGFVAHWLGDSTAEDAGRLTLNPLRHIDVLTTVVLPFILIATGYPPIFAAKPVPFNPARLRYDEFGAALVGLAGPFTNLLLAALAASAIRVLAPPTNGLEFAVFALFAEVNIALFVFNMLPLPPLDGSRLLYAFAPDWLREIMMNIEHLGLLPILLVLLLLMQFIGPFLGNIEADILNFLIPSLTGWGGV